MARVKGSTTNKITPLGQSLLAALVLLGMGGCTTMPWQSGNGAALPAVEAVVVSPVAADAMAQHAVAVMAYPFPPSSTAVSLPDGKGAFRAALDNALRKQGYAVGKSGVPVGFVLDQYQAGVVRAGVLAGGDGWRMDRLYQVSPLSVQPLGGGVLGDAVPVQPMPLMPVATSAAEVESSPVAVEAATASEEVPVPVSSSGGWYVQLMAGKTVDVLEDAKRKLGAGAVLVPLSNGLTALRVTGFADKGQALARRGEFAARYPGAFVGSAGNG